MLLPGVCRTCDATDSDNLDRLTARTEKYPEKMLADLLQELTKIDLAAALADRLPQFICLDCSHKLRNAYDFVLQARTANELLLKHLNKADAIAAVAPDCLQESPMEMCAEQHVEVKMEAEADADDSASMQSADLADVLANFEADMKMSKKSLDPLVMADLKVETDAESSSKELQSDAEKVESEFDDNDSLDDVPLQQRAHKWKTLIAPLKRRKKKPRVYRKTVDATMPKRTANLSERKKAKDLDANLCKPHGYKLIQCMICQSKYDKIADLRRHLLEHPNICSFDEQQHLELSELVELFYPDMKQLSEEQLKAHMRRDLTAGKYARFYSITNQSGYEMDLDSSETESETELETDEQALKPKRTSRASYVCELCQQRYPRKYQLYEHQRMAHSWAEAPHICGRCDARFVSSKLLTHHYESQCKNAQKRFMCHKCPLRFRWKHNLKAHYRDHRSTNQTFECADCKRVFDKKKSLTVHLLSVHADESKLIPCQWCSRKFYRRDYLVKHLKRHGLREQDIPLAETLIAATAKPNGLKSISCKICNLQFERILDLRAHIQLELKLSLSLHQNYDSPLNYSITNASGFELQLEDSETDDETRPAAAEPLYKSPSLYVCELCNVQCRRKYEMILHQRAMHCFDKMPHECELCVFKCVSKNIMEHHRQSQCLSAQKKFVCSSCGFRFMWPENLEQHIRLRHSSLSETIATLALGASSESNRLSDSTANAVPLLQCPHCDRTYQMQSRLNNHIRDVHINGDRKRKEAIKKFLCSLCGKETQSAANLVTHMRRHTGEKPFKCDLCEMAFPRHSEMQSHRRMHTGEKPFHCTVCGKDFARSDKLKRHMLTHSGLKPHKCTYCEKSYRQSKDLNLHLQQHTGECPFECGTCGERFIQSSTLEKHRMMRRHFDEVQ